MATVLSATSAQTEARFVLRGVGWNVYEGIRQALGDHPIRLTFDGRNLEFMSPSPLHESYSYLFGRLLDTITLELRIQIRSGRSITFRRPELERGLKPDNCYWIQNEPAVRGKPDIDLATDPPPDLAIEIDITHGSLDRLAIYSGLGVPEVWRFDGESLFVYLLQSNGEYSVVERSRCLPSVPVQELIPFLQLDEQLGDTTRILAFADWVRAGFRHSKS
jgi:Uma2 family endonuclease